LEDLSVRVSDYIKRHCPIDKALEHYTTLQGRMASCPLHEDKTPSLSVRPEKGLWHCFSCGKGGDAITLVREAEGVDFIEACRILVERFNIPAPVKVHNRSIRDQIRQLEAEGRREEAVALIDQLKKAS
jgi:DNA primase